MIDRFTGEHRFLSNFYPAEIEYAGVKWKTVEHAYQAAKSEDPAYRERVRLALRASDAKGLGRRAVLRPDWDDVKVSIMETLVYRKFDSHPALRALLVRTEGELIEGNSWGDTFWGVCNGRGENHLGKILMKVRGQLRAR
jgi:ribA/ribD-fused uncharacterized protein